MSPDDDSTRADLVRRISAYVQDNGLLSAEYFCRKVANDARIYRRLVAGGGINIDTLDLINRVMAEPWDGKRVKGLAAEHLRARAKSVAVKSNAAA